MKCPNCKTREDEWIDGGDHVYDVSAYRCKGCEKIAWENKSWEDDAGSNKGIYFRLVKPDGSPTVKVPR